jgi:hypothetical protein
MHANIVGRSKIVAAIIHPFHHVRALEREQRNLPKKVKAPQCTQQNVGKHMKK